MTRITVGNVEITPVLDTGLLMNPDYFFPAHAKDVNREYADQLDERGLLPVSITCYLVRSEGKTILVDTGIGGRRRPMFPRGHLPESLDNLGTSPTDIELVIHTHLHVDHVGWNTVDDEAGKRGILFSNAEFVIQKGEWDYWMTPERLGEEGSEHLRECVEPLTNSGRIRFVEDERSFDSNLTFLPTPGHTPGHVSIGIYSAGERATIIGDASHRPMQLAHPDWSPSADIDPVQSVATRTKLFDDAATDGRTWLAGHWQYPGIGKIRKVGNTRSFRAL